MTTIYPCTPDYGDRFARMWEAYHTKPTPRWMRVLQAAVGGLAGLIVAALIAGVM